MTIKHSKSSLSSNNTNSKRCDVKSKNSKMISLGWLDTLLERQIDGVLGRQSVSGVIDDDDDDGVAGRRKVWMMMMRMMMAWRGGDRREEMRQKRGEETEERR